MEFDDQLGKEFLFYGIDNHMFKLDDLVWEATEDDSDGLRSYLESIQVNANSGIFFREPLAIVVLDKDVEYQEYWDAPNEGYRLVDTEADSHVWLSFGTSYHDSYYPCFYFNYTPRRTPLPKKKLAREKTIVLDPFDRFFEEREC